MGCDATESSYISVHQYDEMMKEWVGVGDTIESESPYDSFGAAVSLSANSNIVAAGAPYCIMMVESLGLEMCARMSHLGSSTGNLCLAMRATNLVD